MSEIKQAIITDIREVIKKDSSGKPTGSNHFLSITVLTDYQIWVSPEFAQLYIQHLGEKCFINVEESIRNGQKSLNLVNGGSPVFMPSVPVSPSSTVQDGKDGANVDKSDKGLFNQLGKAGHNTKSPSDIKEVP